MALREKITREIIVEERDEPSFDVKTLKNLKVIHKSHEHLHVRRPRVLDLICSKES